MLALEHYLKTTKLSNNHKELIKIRAWQINGCAYCINMHAKRPAVMAKRNKEFICRTPGENDLFTDEEKALLAPAEEVTLIKHGVPDETYQNAAQYFDAHYPEQTIMAIVAINAWNHMAVSSRTHRRHGSVQQQTGLT